MLFRKPEKSKKTATAPKPAGAARTPAKTSVDTPGYRGPERRRAERRNTKTERRKAVRWEPDKAERRQARGRRKVDGVWSYR